MVRLTVVDVAAPGELETLRTLSFKVSWYVILPVQAKLEGGVPLVSALGVEPGVSRTQSQSH